MEQKRAFVIGASRGIGRAVAYRLAKDGYDIVAACREPDGPVAETERLVKSLGRSFTMAVFDVTDRIGAAREIDRLQEAFDLLPDLTVYFAWPRFDAATKVELMVPRFVGLDTRLQFGGDGGHGQRERVRHRGIGR